MLQLPNLIAHRGGMEYAPENTLAALTAAKHYGAGWVEIDIRLTKDNHLVCFHDDTLQRITGQARTVEDNSLAELKQIDVGTRFGSPYQGETIPTLHELVICLTNHSLSANLDLKTANNSELLVYQLKQFLQTNHKQSKVIKLLSSFDPELIRLLKKEQIETPRVYILDQWSDNWETICLDTDCYSLNLNHTEFTKTRLKTVNLAGCQMLTYTVNSPSRAKELLSAGVASVFTDVPDLLRNGF